MKQWKRLTTRYLDEKRAAGWSPGTLEAAARWFKKFLLWCNEQGLQAPAQVTAAHVEHYRQFLLCVPGKHGFYKLNSVDQALRVLRQFFFWAVERQHLLFSPTQDLVLPRIETRLPGLSVGDVRRVFEVAESGTMLGLRDRALLETYYRTGASRGECLRLKVADVDFEERVIRLGDRLVRMPDELAHTLGRYLRECRPQLARGNEEALFLSGNGTPYNEGCLSQMVQRMSRRLGFRVTAHRLRHACAVHMIEAGADFAEVQRQLGHRSTKSAAVYSQMATAALSRQPKGTQPWGRKLTHFTSLVGEEARFDETGPGAP